MRDRYFPRAIADIRLWKWLPYDRACIRRPYWLHRTHPVRVQMLKSCRQIHLVCIPAVKFARRYIGRTIRACARHPECWGQSFQTHRVRYMSGKVTMMTAKIAACQVIMIRRSNHSKSGEPMTPFGPSSRSKKKPTTVGGKTIGMVRMTSQIPFTLRGR